ncbi:hypothetical protein PINS_up022970 [Pythium insidiosum]|nr:hypothetical protein PINS_up022970 [Pythium insidiosum]
MLLLPLAPFSTTLLYLTVSSLIRLQNQWYVVLYTLASVALKVFVQEIVKQKLMSSGIVNPLGPSPYPSFSSIMSWLPHLPPIYQMHSAMTISTVLIDAQIRVVVLQLGWQCANAENSATTTAAVTSLAVMLSKLVFRVVKILRLRYLLTSRFLECKNLHRILRRVNSKLALRDTAIARNEYAHYLQWKDATLRLHAAEVYADMHGEYIAIGCAVIVLLLFDGHAMYRLTIGLNEEDIRKWWHFSQLLAAASQLATGLCVDFVLGAVEGVHEVPLFETIDDYGSPLRNFLRVLLVSVAGIHVGIIAIFSASR